MDEKFHLDQMAILTLRIDNSEPVEMGAFVKIFTSLAKEYRSSIQGDGNLTGEADLYISEVRKGSIVADIIPVVAPALPIIASHAEQVYSVVEFVNRWSDRIKSLASGIVPENFTKSDLKNYLGAVEAIARDPHASSTLEASTFEDGERNVKVAFKFTTRDAVAVEKVIDAEFRRLDISDASEFSRVLMVFTRSDVGDAPKDKRSGEKVLISDISDKALPIIYASELAEQRVKHEIRDADENIYKKGFNVDVSVQYRGLKPVVYRILNVHEVIDLPDED